MKRVPATDRQPAGPAVRRLAGPLVVATLLAAAGPAAAADVTFTFRGRGFGHGVGMSQYGARGAAQQGWDAARILAWYYRGTTLETRPSAPVRVLLDDGLASVGVGSNGTAAAVADGQSTPLTPGATYTARPGGPGVQLVDPAGTVVAQSAGAIRIAPQDALVLSRGTRYRGVLDVSPSAGGVRVVNTVDSEQYLQGVVPSEMPASWGDATPAALQAQAVAARTYALADLAPSRGFDLYDDTRSQVYLGIDHEDRRSNAAVTATRGQALTYQGRLITAYFSSTSGGHTENVENSLGGSPQPYLVGVPDPYDDVSPLHLWPRPPVFTGDQLGARLRIGGTVADVTVLRRGVSPRVMTARFTTTDGRVVDLSGNTVKARLDLPDTWFWVWRSDQPEPAEPPVDGTSANAAPPTAPVPAAPAVPVAPRPVSLVVQRGRWLTVAARTRSRAQATRIRSRIRPHRPRAVTLRRVTRGHSVYLVATGRYRTRAAALTERNRLRRLRYPAAAVVAARAGDPAIGATPARVATDATVTPATTSGPFRVVAAQVGTAADATALTRRLASTGRTPTIVSRWTAATGTRYMVVTLSHVARSRADAERAALAALGFGSARVQKEG